MLALASASGWADGALSPKIVLQSQPAAGVDVAAWTADDRFLLTASGIAREFAIWDVERGVIVDRVRLPKTDAATGAEMLMLTSLAVSGDGRTAVLAGRYTDLNAGVAPLNRRYDIDLRTRVVRSSSSASRQGAGNGVEDYTRWIGALEVIYRQGTDMSLAQAEALLPALPASHDGRFRLRRRPEGLELAPQAGGARRLLSAAPVLGIDDAALAPDGRRLAFVIEETVKQGAVDVTQVELFDTATGRFGKPAQLVGDYELLRWLNDSQFLVTAGSPLGDLDSDYPEDQGPPPPAVIVDASNGQVIRSFPGRCYMLPLAGGRFLGAGVANCRPKSGNDRALAVFDPATGQWQALRAFRPEPGATINLLAASPDGSRLAVAWTAAAGAITVALLDPAGTILNARNFPDGGIMAHMEFAADNETLYLAGNGHMSEWQTRTDQWRALDAQVTLPTMFASDGGVLLASGAAEDAVVRLDLASGAAAAPLELANASAGGFLPGRPVFWSASLLNGVRLWDTRDWSVLLTLYFFQGQRYLAVTPEGRYDTNLGPDAAQFRWLMADAPFQSLAPQTFMRDYFEPRLTQRLLDCVVARSCATVLKPLPPMASLNRVLPSVAITGIVAGSSPGEAIVTVEVSEGTDPGAANGKTRSGIYNLRLFRNNRFIAQDPDDPVETVRLDLAAWRKRNQVGDGDSNAVFEWRFTVPVPTGPGTEQQEFSAYAFNEDRVKSETTRFTYRTPATPPRKPRAFVIAVGIDDYDEPRLRLQFAAGDARLIGERLADIAGYETHRVMLSAASGAGPRITRAVLASLLGILSGADRDQALGELRAAGVDATPLEQSTPDDVVIISFAGHGWADKLGNFYLVPIDASWPAGASAPDITRLVSAADLTMWLRDIEAADIAVIIDACHSAASVDAGDFKPGPMGDAGLGQLSFDKGMRILAATQADDVALEDPGLRQGLLTYALAGEGLTADGGKADLDRDGRIVLDEWLRYATVRLPSLSSDARVGRLGGGAGSRGFNVVGGGALKKPRTQEPSLFDFTNQASTVVLRRVPR